MKLATLQQGGRDGTLVVVSRDLGRCRAVPAIARTLLRWTTGPRWSHNCARCTKR